MTLFIARAYRAGYSSLLGASCTLLFMLMDTSQRQHAIDPARSFIVQAPAGSGKTSLLVDRYLALLAHSQPEAILAITFTKKAAAEMRQRVLHAIELAQIAESPLRDQTRQLALKVVKRAGSSPDQIAQYLQQLRIKTIDAFCFELINRLPLSARIGLTGELSDDATPYYQQAVEGLLSHVETDEPWSPAIRQLFLTFDNDGAKLRHLLTDVLMIRDQWMPYLIVAKKEQGLRSILEQGLDRLVCSHFQALHQQLTVDQKQQLLTLMRFAAQHRVQTEPQWQTVLDLIDFPAAVSEHFQWYQCLVDILLQKSGDFRKSVTIKQGFPAPSSAKDAEQKQHVQQHKQAMLDLLAECANDKLLHEILQEISVLPSVHYSAENWSLLNALLEILPVLLGELHVVFQQQQVVDYIAIAAGAYHAMRDDEHHSDLALKLDQKLEHILVDEFQDTSMSQYRLLEQLVQAWQPGDGRTLFLVGDPMQSIYRFRHAEVSLFIKAKEKGIAEVKLESLQLTQNFRSSPTIVDWINNRFAAMMPSQDNRLLGAIAYHPSHAAQPFAGKVQTMVTEGYCQQAEAMQMVKCIQQVQVDDCHQSIAVLVRSRSDCAQLITELNQHQIDYCAVDIDPLIEKPAIGDLISLTYALCHLGDRLSWLAICRAPWCGLTLADLLVIAGKDETTVIWHRLQNYQQLTELSPQGYQRLNNVVPIIEQALALRGQCDLSSLVAQTWHALAGPKCLLPHESMSDIETFFQVLDHYAKPPYATLYQYLETHLQRHYAQNTQRSHYPVQIMTMHKAKGLEFDVVLLPGLGRMNPAMSHQLFMLSERPLDSGGADLLFAPLQIDDEHDALYQYLRRQEKKKQALEKVRLLYVAMTRAKRQLWCFGHIDQEKAVPATGSFLHILWPNLDVSNIHIIDPVDDESQQALFYRLPLSVPRPVLPTCETAEPMGLPPWRGFVERAVGTVVHACLKIIADNGVDGWQQRGSQQQQSFIDYLLTEQGIDQHHTSSRADVMKMINNTLACKRGQWILSPHLDAKSEQSYCQKQDGQIKTFIVDRTFIEDETRWVIDYKTSEQPTGNIQQGLADLKNRYQAQCEQYGALFAGEGRPVKCGLYFLVFGGWIEWELNTH